MCSVIRLSWIILSSKRWITTTRLWSARLHVPYNIWWKQGSSYVYIVWQRFGAPRKHIYIILTPFYIVKLKFTGVYIIFLISAQNIDYRYLLELPHRSGSNEYPQSMFWAEMWKVLELLHANFQFLVVNFFNIFEQPCFYMFNNSAVLKPRYKIFFSFFRLHTIATTSTQSSKICSRGTTLERPAEILLCYLNWVYWTEASPNIKIHLLVISMCSLCLNIVAIQN